MKRPAISHVFILIFVVLAVIAHMVPYFKIDLYISQQVQSLSSDQMTKIMELISLIGNMSFMPILMATVFTCLYLLNLKIEALISIVSVLSALFINGIVKYLVNRPRPTSSLVDVYSNLSDKSFPSGHTMIYTVIFGYLLYLSITKGKNKIKKRLLTALLFLPIVLVGISRVYLGAHWPSDVIGGYLFGFIWLYIIINYYRRIQVVQS